MCKYRPATENDYKGICSLVKNREEMFLFYPKGNYPLTIDQLHALSKVRKEFTVVVKNGEIIGFANIFNFNQGKFAFIGNVIIDKKHRGKGIGKELVSYMLTQGFNKYNLAEVRISVFSENTTALLLYCSFGFIPYAVQERKNHKGKRVALIHLKLSKANAINN